MTPLQGYIKVIDYIIEGKGGQQNAIELFLLRVSDTSGVEKALETLFLVEKGQVAQDVMLDFISLLPKTEWITIALDLMLQKPERWCSWAVARVLRKHMAHYVGKELMLAEMVWIERLSFNERAIASSIPIKISSTIGDNALYVAGKTYSRDRDNDRPFCWKGEWEPELNKELWRITPAPTGSSCFYIVSVFTNRYLYVLNNAPCQDTDGYSLKTVLVCAKNALPDSAGIWRLLKLEEDKCAFYNVNHDTFLSSPAKATDGSRRAVIASPFHPLDEKRSVYREWRIAAATIPFLELGLHDFFKGAYDRAVQTFTAILSEKLLSSADRKKTLCYRMVANWMLKNEGCANADVALLEPLGGCPDYFLVALYGKLADDEKKVLRRCAHMSFEV